MSGPNQFLQGLLVIPREVTYDEDNRTLTRITEVWLTGQAASAGPDAIRNNGLLIGLGLQQGGGSPHNIQQFCVAIGIKDRYQTPRTAWMTLPLVRGFTRALQTAFGHFGKWQGYELTTAMANAVAKPANTRCESLLFKLVIDNFQPARKRHFQVDAMVVTLGGSFDLEDHYLLGLGVLTTGKQVPASGGNPKVIVIEDYMTLTQATDRTVARPTLPTEPPTDCATVAIGHPAPAPQGFACQEPRSAAPRKRATAARRRKVKKPARRRR